MASGSREALWERLACAAIGGVLGALAGIAVQLAWIAIAGTSSINPRFVLGSYLAGTAVGILIGPAVLNGVLAFAVFAWGLFRGSTQIFVDDCDPAAPRPLWISLIILLGAIVGAIIYMSG